MPRMPRAVTTLLTLAVPLTLLVACGGEDGDSRSREPAAAESVPEGSASAYLEALYERDGEFELAGEESLLTRGRTVCDLAEQRWQEWGVDAAGNFHMAITAEIDVPTLAILNEALDHLCPELNPDNVPKGEVPEGVEVDPAARQPRSELDGAERFDFNAIVTLKGAGGGGDKQGGFARECHGTGRFAGLRTGAEVRVSVSDGSYPPTVGEVGSGIVKGPDCEFFITALDAPVVDVGYEIEVAGLEPLVVPAEDAVSAEWAPARLVIGP